MPEIAGENAELLENYGKFRIAVFEGRVAFDEYVYHYAIYKQQSDEEVYNNDKAYGSSTPNEALAEAKSIVDSWLEDGWKVLNADVTGPLFLFIPQQGEVVLKKSHEVTPETIELWMYQGAFFKPIEVPDKPNFL